MVKLRLVDASDDKSFTEEGAFRVVTYNVISHILHLFYYSDTLKKRLCLSFMGRILIKNVHSLHNQCCMFIVNSSSCSVKLLPHIWVFISIIIKLHNRNFIWEHWIIEGFVKEMSKFCKSIVWINPLSPELNPICYLLALLGAHHFLHVSRISVKLLTLRRLMSYTYGAPILDVSRSHTTTQHSR